MPPPQDLLQPAPPTTSGESVCLCSGAEASVSSLSGKRRFLFGSEQEKFQFKQKKETSFTFESTVLARFDDAGVFFLFCLQEENGKQKKEVA